MEDFQSSHSLTYSLDMSNVDEIATYISPLEDLVINKNYKEMKFEAKKFNTISFRSPDNNLRR